MAIDKDTVRNRDDPLHSDGDTKDMRGASEHCDLACMAMEVRCITGLVL